MSFPEKCSFAPPKVYGGSLQRASSSAGEMSGGEEKREVYEDNNVMWLTFMECSHL